MTRRVLVAIVNYRSADLVIACLRSLAAESKRLSVVVVDNASGDGSAERLTAAIEELQCGAWVEFLALDRNGGFAAGNNAAVRRGLELADGNWPEFVWYLNPDTYVRAGACAELLAFLDAHPDVGIVGSRLEDPDGTGQASRYRFPSLAGELEAGFRLGLLSRLLAAKVVDTPLVTHDHETDWVAGASMMVRKAVFDAVGLMDEAYFLYFEETDFCLAAKRAGWRCWYVPQSRVVHLVGQSTGVTERNVAPRRLPTYWFASRRRYFQKNHGRVYTFWCDVVWTIGFATWRVRRRLQRKPDMDPPHMLSDFVCFNFLARQS
ncbi:MAG: glycosyltransferase family 2 protein [Planctomycetes bacterium]|nr:glycosyltransferase family 2 protein [Planctomycetota bacterium]